ncbi:phosphatase 2C-like domain-containing protein [Coniella lustricola]|uniref:Phosphatase 2C-like domain-containing protein n=1 Tax=Coniella lustricola TaxID=2025994 RepID=A0A2T3AK08_9PEZI|nr:phosphatase 2C-like domain-containing protein [Coniella lustricola]
MFGGSSSSADKAEPTSPESPAKSTGSKSPSPDSTSAKSDGPGSPSGSSPTPIKTPEQVVTGEKRSGNGSPPSTGAAGAKRRSGGQTPIQKLGKQDPSLVVPQGQHNNAAGESLPGPKSTFRVGVWEDRNKKCRRTMEDTHAFLYNFLHTPAPALPSEAGSVKSPKTSVEGGAPSTQDVLETDNGYFAIFDGHAGTFAADWCGKKLHIILEDIIKKNPNAPIPELLDQTFTTVDAQLEKLPLKNSGCTAAIAVLRWEERVPSNASQTGSQSIAPALAKATEKIPEDPFEGTDAQSDLKQNTEAERAKLKGAASRQRVLYTANVGDARIVLCRSGKALRLSYDHKGSDENEGKRITHAGGLILNNRVNGVLAVTRALGDTYMKDLVTGHPYTTETVIQPDMDEFMIIACDGLWDVCSDQEAVDLVRNVHDPATASKLLVDHALARFSTDNLSCMIVRFDKEALVESQNNENIGVEVDPASTTGKISEAEKIVGDIKKQIEEGGNAVGVSASNSGKGRDPNRPDQEPDDSASFTPTVLNDSLQEEPSEIDGAAEPASDKSDVEPGPKS